MSQSVSFDEGFEAPDFHKEGLHKCCVNTAKGAKVNGNDSNCTNNCEKLYAECERLSEIAKKKNTIINQRRKEYERFMREKKNFEDEKKKGGVNVGGGSGISETDMKAKDAEIAYLEAQLRKKEEENVKLKKDIERVVSEQMKTLEKMKEADNSFLGANNDNIDMMNAQIAELKKENSVMQFQINRAEREKALAVQDAVAAQVMKQGAKENTGAEISDDQLRNAMDNTYDVQKKVYYAFNKDLKKRLSFISNLIEWDEWADILIDNEERNTSFRGKKRQNQTPRVKDGELANEHWAASKSELAQIMMKVYFPVIDVQEHDQIVGREDLAIKMETEKIHDTLAVELITLQNILTMLSGQQDPQSKKFSPSVLSETQKNIIAGLMQRLFYQLPAYEPGTIGKERQRSNDFQVQVTNLYLLLQKRISLKQVFQASLDVNMTKQTQDIDSLTESIMSTICDFEAFCEIEESQIEARRRAPVAVHDQFQKKIFEKMMRLQQANPDNNISLSNLGLNNAVQKKSGSATKRNNFVAYEQSPQSAR